MPKPKFKHDVCLSFASEDRDYVEKVAEYLISLGVSVFYDRYEQADLWGKDLYVHLDEVYRKSARYCIIFISKHYSKKLWTNHERKSAQARAFEGHGEYILPARIDSTEIPGLPPTVGYISLKGLTPEAFSQLVKAKLDGKHNSRRQLDEAGEFRRICYEGFDTSHLTAAQVKRQFASIWLIGQRGCWRGKVADGVHQLSNLKKTAASLNNTLRYFDLSDRQIDLGDCRVSVRVRVEPPNDNTSGAGLLFREADDGTAAYAYCLHPGHSVSLMEKRLNKMSVLWSQEIPEVVAESFTTLKIVGKGRTLSMYVNDSLIHTIRSAKLRTGNTGTMVMGIGRFTFDDFSIFLPTKAISANP